jgi:hypothetical protein
MRLSQVLASLGKLERLHSMGRWAAVNDLPSPSDSPQRSCTPPWQLPRRHAHLQGLRRGTRCRRADRISLNRSTVRDSQHDIRCHLLINQGNGELMPHAAGIRHRNMHRTRTCPRNPNPQRGEAGSKFTRVFLNHGHEQ